MIRSGVSLAKTACALCLSATTLTSHARAGQAGARAIATVELQGAERTRKTTILALLPRQPPATYEPAELVELERRLSNLGIFDKVAVRIEDARLIVAVREKWTLIPSLELATGRTWTDTFIAVGATEYNFLGSASQLSVFGSWQDGGLNGAIGWQAHPYDPRSGAPFADASYASSYLSFDSGEAWRRDQAGGELGWQLPYPYRAPLRVRAWMFGYHERISEGLGLALPRSGVALGTGVEIAWDHFAWDDLAPAGYLLSLDVSSAAFLPATEPRHDLALNAGFALKLSSTAVLGGQLVAEAVSAGNVNHSLLLSSWQEVRGLTDSFYRNEAQLTGNVELRQAWRFAERWALQGVLFADAALFRPFDAHGQAGSSATALGVGGGVRLIPTLVADVVPRVDVGRLFSPDQHWFFQFGLAQFF